MPRKKTKKTVEKSSKGQFNKITEKLQSISSRGPSNLLVVLLIVMSFFAGYLFFKLKSLEQTTKVAKQQQVPNNQPPARQPVTMAQIKKLFGNGFINFGDTNRKVLFVEILDPSCPFCHIAAGENPDLARESGRFQYVSDGGSYSPPVVEMRKLLDEGKASYAVIYANGHGNGRLAMQALYCADEKDKFWDVHDLLMNNDGYKLVNDTVKNEKANIPQLVTYLQPAIDSTFLQSCLESGKYEQTISRDEEVGRQLGFQGTPDFFVNTTNFGGAQDYKSMEPAVKEALGG